MVRGFSSGDSLKVYPDVSSCLCLLSHHVSAPRPPFVPHGFMVCQIFCVLFLCNSCLQFVCCPFVVSYMPVSLNLHFFVLTFLLAILCKHRPVALGRSCNQTLTERLNKQLGLTDALPCNSPK